MEMAKYDEQSGAVTITFSKMEFIAIHSVLGGVLNTYKFQDPRIIDVPHEELRQVYYGIADILKQLVKTLRK
jgi:hypothetical protein